MSNDRIHNKSVALLSSIPDMVDAHKIDDDAINAIIEDILITNVMDIAVHFGINPPTDKPYFELWKRNMGLNEYIAGILLSLHTNENWDVNWIRGTYDVDITEDIRTICNQFLSVC